LANTEFYKGRRSRRKNYALLPTIIVLSLLVLTVVLFYAMQKYAVITKEGVNVELPMFSESKETVDESGNVVKQFDPVDVSLTYDNTDYSVYEAVAGKDVEAVRAIFVPCTELNSTAIGEYTSRLSSGNALMLEMKPRSGNLMWYSNTPLAINYGISVYNETTTYINDIITSLKSGEHPVYLIAKISCCIDSALPARCTTVSLLNNYGGYFSNSDGIWLDPYNQQVRSYIVDMVRELYDMGFDEVVLADVMAPALEEGETVQYSTQLSTTPTAAGGVNAFAISVAKQLEDREGVLSICVNSKAALTGTDGTTGQNGPLFFKLYDRVYLETDRYEYTYIIPSLTGIVTVGKVSDRFVPIVENYLPDNASGVSWVLVDVEED